MECGGNWLNNGTFTFNGELTFNGTESQNITTGSVAFDSITTNSTAISLQDNLIINKNLTLTAGVINTGTHTVSFKDNATSNIGNANSFINGEIIKEGDDAFTFPTGDTIASTNHWAPIGIAAPGNAADKISAKYTYASPEGVNGAAAPWNALDAGLAYVSSLEYWELETTGSTYPAVTLYFKDSSFSNIPNGLDLAIGHWNGSKWENIGGTIDPVNLDNITSDSVLTSYSPFTFASKSEVNALPIELLEFNAEVNSDKKVDLKWKTATEINNEFFTIERSIDAVNFEYVSNISAVGNSNNINSYSSIDENPYTGVSYYRLKQTDTDGSFTYSEIRTVNIEGIDIINIFPIPATEDITFEVNIYEEAVITLSLINDIGQLVYKKEFLLNEGKNVITIPIQQFSEGMYFVEMKINNENISVHKHFVIGQR